MTIAERVAALQRLREAIASEKTDIAKNEYCFNDFHKAVSDLMERDVWTHELAFFDALIAEVRSGESITMHDILGKIPKDKQVIIVAVDEPAAENGAP